MIVCVATEEEAKLTDKECIITGVGVLNVIMALSNINRAEHIHNIGYVGSNRIEKGTKVRIGKCKLFHPNVEYEEPEFILDGDTLCLTAGDFVTETKIEEPCVFDMELAAIAAMGFRKVTSEKIVSDNLSVQEYEKTIEERK